ncbi:MAG TPA: aminodeoxychorismate/anthranilate synthase component II [Symbiobacteriaceae bacterium]|nr:aminodeoxychorismate/anthranilate synthase component II [Symbiobacteriaceae bacterium]
MILVIDNYDSFTYNLVQYLGELGAELQVVRNDALTAEDVVALNPEKIILSPGPCTPNEAGITLDVIKAMGAKVPILGVCLGHQSIGQAFGAKVVRANRPVHGKTSAIHHDGKGLFRDLPTPFRATRYHSLVVEELPAELEATAFTEDGIVMAMQHRELPVYGVQFHPESIMTEHGKQLLQNFLAV